MSEDIRSRRARRAGPKSRRRHKTVFLPLGKCFSAISSACAICSRCVATASGTMRSSVFITSTISIAVARSIEAVRGLRRSVARGSSIGDAEVTREVTGRFSQSRKTTENHVKTDICTRAADACRRPGAVTGAATCARAEPSCGFRGVGLFNGNDVSDGATGARGTSDVHRLRSIGFAGEGDNGNFHRRDWHLCARAFHVHRQRGRSSCSRCAAHCDMMTVGGLVPLRRRTGLHQVIEASAGALQYRT